MRARDAARWNGRCYRSTAMACVCTHINSFVCLIDVFFSFASLLVCIAWIDLSFTRWCVYTYYFLVLVVFSLCSLWTSGRHSCTLDVVLKQTDNNNNNKIHYTNSNVHTHRVIYYSFILFLFDFSFEMDGNACANTHNIFRCNCKCLLISDRKRCARACVRALVHSFLPHSFASGQQQLRWLSWVNCVRMNHCRWLRWRWMRDKVWEKKWKSNFF